MIESLPERLDEEDEFILRFSRSQCTLYAFILGLTHDASDADDVLQEVNLALWRKRHTYDSKYEFVPWAIGFARIEVNNYRKKRGKRRLLFSDDVLNTIAGDWPEDVTFQEQRLVALSSCIQKLKPMEKDFIACYYRENISVSEMSEKYDKPPSTVYKVLNRARKALRMCIQGTLAQSSHPIQ